MGRLLLVDGHSILNRAFYGLPDLTDSEGRHTGAVYGFLTILFKLIDDEKPDSLTVAFDSHAPTFRHEVFSEYKGTRKGMPDELREQVPLIKEVLDVMGITRIERDGLEADDLLGTMARKAADNGDEVLLLSGDRDLLQIADERITILLPHTKGGRTTMERFTPELVKSTYGVDPKGFIELKALMGDSSDNVPGVPRVGEKTARELMETYGSISGIYANLENITKKAVRESLRENRDVLVMSKFLVTIKTDADIDWDIDRAAIGDIFNPKAYEMFMRLSFKNLMGRFTASADVSGGGDDAGASAVKASVVRSKEEARAVFERVSDAGEAGYFLLKEGKETLGVAIYLEADDGGEAWFLKCEEAPPGPSTGSGTGGSDAGTGDGDPGLGSDFIRECMEGPDAVLYTADAKEGYDFFTPAECLVNEEGYEIKKLFDIIIAAYLLNPLKSDYCVEDIAMEYLGETLDDKDRVFGKKAVLKEIDDEKLAGYACARARVCLLSAGRLEERLDETGMAGLFRGIEMPLSYILYEMESAGIRCDRDALKEYGDALTGRIGELEKEIHTACGTEFNILSPKQLGEVLFGKMGIPGGKKTKTGYSTAADVLEKLAYEYPVVNDILEYRGLTKLKSTYADGLSEYILDDGRIHTRFKQTITATGRLSSAEPNLQNIPMRTEEGRRIRKVFLPEEGRVFVDADYSQIELRILAHMSDDDSLIEAYHEGEDIHRITASKVFHTPFEEVTPAQRSNAKAVNFGIVYGISAFGLGNDLSISRSEAKEYMEQYFATYPGVKRYQEETVKNAKENGYVETLYGRRRPMPELKSSNFMQRSFGERVAMNAPIQGTAADIMKIAMLKVWRTLRREGLKARMILQIHDELLIEAPFDEADRVAAILEAGMDAAASLKVPLTVDCHRGSDWYECK